jgi:hypothetical protein
MAMADRYLQEDHAFAIARNAPQDVTRVNPEPDERTSWVMLSRSGSLVRLPHEHILHTTNSRVSLEVSVPKSLQGRTSAPFTLKSDNGTTYITNQRVSRAQVVPIGCQPGGCLSDGRYGGPRVDILLKP